MTPEDFCYWLKGFYASHGIDKKISKRLSKVTFEPDATAVNVELLDSLKFALHVIEKGIEARIGDQWPAIRDLLPEVKERSQRAIENAGG